MASFRQNMAFAVAESWIRRKILRSRIPAALHVEVTTNCQLTCQGCYVERTEGQSWTATSLTKLVTEAEELGIRQFSFSGGEPFLEADTVLAVARAQPKSAFIVVTNGIAVDEGLAAALAEVGNVGVLVSHDGPGTDHLRGTGVLDAAEGAMERLRRAGIFLGASVRVARETAGDVLTESFMARLASLGVSLAVFAPLLPGQPGLTGLEDEERSNLPRLVERLGRRARIRAVVPCGRGERACAGGALVAALAADGSAMPCPHIRQSTHRWPNSSLRAILDSPLFRELAQPRTPVAPGRSCLVLDRADELEAILERHAP